MKEPRIDLIVHATHEAGFKVGGIGAVLEGLLGTAAYNRAIGRTILVGPMNTGSSAEMARLTAPRNQLEVHYSSWHRIDEVSSELSRGLRSVEARYRVHLLYGRRTFAGVGDKSEQGVQHEVLLVDASGADLGETNICKMEFWHHFQIESDLFEWIDEFDLVVKAARPSLAALDLLAAKGSAARFLIAHEWMGLPLAFCMRVHTTRPWKLIYYAHEMPTARILVEDHSGHDTRFYNTLRLARTENLTMGELFGERNDFFKHVLVRRAVHLDRMFAVGQWVKNELHFMGGEFASADIDVVFNGVPFREIGFEQRMASGDRLKQYCQNLLGYRPDYVFSHVTRMLISKGLWRDITVLDHLDAMLAKDGKQAVLFLLSTSEPAGTAAEDILRWEREYGWPVVHHADNGDLVGHEVPLYRGIEAFNARARAVKIVFVNQYGWSQDRCGRNMPVDMSFDDIRQGTDLEFGQSIYEPFGIAQIEPLGFGAVCVVSNVCGCIGLVERAAREGGLGHFTSLLQADYTTLPIGHEVFSPWDALWIDRGVRDRLEKANSYNVALAIRATLPTTEKQACVLLKRGQQFGRQISWEIVARDYFLPALLRT